MRRDKKKMNNLVLKENLYLQAKVALEDYMKELRKKVHQQRKNNVQKISDQVISLDKRSGFLYGKYVNRLVVFMRGTGCSQIKKNGGCTCCGFYSISNLGVKIDDDFYIEEIQRIIEDKENKITDFEIICLYNDGSLLNEEEFSFNILLYMINALNSIESIKKIVIEAKVNDITEEKLQKIRKTTDKEFEITIGYESSNEKVRQLCVNRPFTNKDFEEKIKIAKYYNISIVPLLMVKPAFLSELESIEDFVASLSYLEGFDLERIDMELPTVMKDTLNFDLWANRLYKPITFWSVIEILRQRESKGFKTPIYVSPMVYSVAAIDKAGNCEKCSDSVYRLFETYNKIGDISVFDNLDCECKQKWIESLQYTNDIDNLENTVILTLNKLKDNE